MINVPLSQKEKFFWSALGKCMRKLANLCKQYKKTNNAKDRKKIRFQMRKLEEKYLNLCDRINSSN